MKRIDFENGTVTRNIFSAAIPMLVAQILSLLYNIVDRIYIARIPEVGTTALGAVGLCFPLIVIITAFSKSVWQWRRSCFFYKQRYERQPESAGSDEHFLYYGVRKRDHSDDSWYAFCKTSAGTFWSI